MQELKRLKMVEEEITQLIIAINERNVTKLKPHEIKQLTNLLYQLRLSLAQQIKDEESL